MIPVIIVMNRFHCKVARTGPLSWRTSRRSSLVVAIGASTFVVGRTLGLFTGQAANSANTLSTGTIVIDDVPDSAFITASGMYPGDATIQQVEIQNNGTLELRYAMMTATFSLDLKGLDDQLQLTIRTKTANPCSSEDGTILYGPKGLKGGDLRNQAPGQQARDRVLAASAREQLCFKVELPTPRTRTRERARRRRSRSMPSRLRTTPRPSGISRLPQQWVSDAASSRPKTPTREPGTTPGSPSRPAHQTISHGHPPGLVTHPQRAVESGAFEQWIAGYVLVGRPKEKHRHDLPLGAAGRPWGHGHSSRDLRRGVPATAAASRFRRTVRPWSSGNARPMASGSMRSTSGAAIRHRKRCCVRFGQATVRPSVATSKMPAPVHRGYISTPRRISHFTVCAAPMNA